MFCLLVNNLNGVVPVDYYEQPDVGYFMNPSSIFFFNLIHLLHCTIVIVFALVH